MKKLTWFFIVVIILFFFLFAVLRIGFDFQGEDSWIRDSNGDYVKHGNPAPMTGVVRESQGGNSGVELKIEIPD